LTHEQEKSSLPDPNESPFETPPTEGMPYEKGSLEDRTIERILKDREARESSSGL